MISDSLFLDRSYSRRSIKVVKKNTMLPKSIKIEQSLQRYWRHNIKITIALLFVWAIVGLGCGILFADFLNEFKVSGYPLGFWFAQQGAIIFFVLIILIYAVLLNALDDRHSREIQNLTERNPKV